MRKLSALSTIGGQAKFRRTPATKAKTKRYVNGARPPAGVLSTIGYRKPQVAQRPAVMMQRGGSSQPLSFDEALGVRDQGERGTCVAHALAAVREFRCGRALSPQFLFWAAKLHGGDPDPGEDGTKLSYAKSALAKIGVCEEHHWPYVGNVIAPNVTHGDPSAVAKHNATAYVHGTYYESSTVLGGHAGKLLTALCDAQAPVAASFAVFADSPSATINNWTQRDPLPVGVHELCLAGSTGGTAASSGVARGWTSVFSGRPRPLAR